MTKTKHPSRALATLLIKIYLCAFTVRTRSHSLPRWNHKDIDLIACFCWIAFLITVILLAAQAEILERVLIVLVILVSGPPYIPGGQPVPEFVDGRKKATTTVPLVEIPAANRFLATTVGTSLSAQSVSQVTSPTCQNPPSYQDILAGVSTTITIALGNVATTVNETDQEKKARHRKEEAATSCYSETFTQLCPGCQAPVSSVLDCRFMICKSLSVMMCKNSNVDDTVREGRCGRFFLCNKGKVPWG